MTFAPICSPIKGMAGAIAYSQRAAAPFILGLILDSGIEWGEWHRG